MSFCTVVNCMDGRVQEPVINYLKDYYKVKYVDSVTEPGPNKILAEDQDSSYTKSIVERINISVGKHNSVGLAVVGHFGCAGNPVEYEEQLEHLEKSASFLKEQYEGMEVLKLWVDENWNVNKL